jgi:hypothetical protein
MNQTICFTGSRYQTTNDLAMRHPTGIISKCISHKSNQSRKNDYTPSLSVTKTSITGDLSITTAGKTNNTKIK